MSIRGTLAFQAWDWDGHLTYVVTWTYRRVEHAAMLTKALLSGLCGWISSPATGSDVDGAPLLSEASVHVRTSGPHRRLDQRPTAAASNPFLHDTLRACYVARLCIMSRPAANNTCLAGNSVWTGPRPCMHVRWRSYVFNDR